MDISANIVEHSVSEAGASLATLSLTLPRIILAELNTHRVFSKNASSTRAIPVKRLGEMAISDPYEPVRWGCNQSGMQAKQENLSYPDQQKAEMIWHRAANECYRSAIELSEIGLHKQWAGRMLEWFSYSAVLVSSTEWDNFFNLRIDPGAQPEIEILATKIRNALDNSVPRVIKLGDWHLPYVRPEERERFSLEEQKIISAARCARVSYMNHEGRESTFEEDYNLYSKLILSKPMHASPVEHQATPYHFNAKTEQTKNFTGWIQNRAFLELQ